jgi:hypothetical protein
MTQNKFKEKEDLFADYCPDQLTVHLIQRLKMVLSSGSYTTYLNQANERAVKHELNIEGQLKFFCEGILDPNRINTIRQASKTWNGLELAYRLTVLDAFATLFYERLKKYNAAQRTIIFCQIFIRDLVDVLTSE